MFQASPFYDFSSISRFHWPRLSLPFTHKFSLPPSPETNFEKKMVHSRFALAAIAAAVLGSASGKMNITSPGGPSQWWSAYSSPPLNYNTKTAIDLLLLLFYCIIVTDSWNRITWTDNILQNFTVRYAPPPISCPHAQMLTCG